MLAELPHGWATAAALHCLDETDDPHIGVCEWFHAFGKSAACKRSGLDPPALLAQFVIALNSLQVMGFASASKRQRGMLQKMAYSEEGLLAPPR